ncbi:MULTISPECIES: hypothetical protein [unclassified Shewanella]|uniref:hypothetical protein n=1 Tax=unclassified Shewanella TaxID=196818 RepID=UPI0006D689F0|nr:hypothetical protein [Shewanella sp. P1-14-1]KPZ67945.1 hypothetical protein AN944_03859 [Shewanella sp. P1-14-1]
MTESQSALTVNEAIDKLGNKVDTSIFQLNGNSEQNQFSRILNEANQISDTSAAATSLTKASETFSLDTLQQQMLASTGLDNETILSLSMSDDMVSEMQQGLLSSLQTSIVESALTQAISANSVNIEDGVAINTSTDNIVGAQSSENESLVDDVYYYSFGEDGFDSKDVIDSINILHHTPILSYIYQETTGDKISPASTLAGSLLYSDYVGVGSTAIKLAMEYFTESNPEMNITDVGDLLSNNNDELTESEVGHSL